MATVQRTERGHASPRVSSELLDRMPPHSIEAERGVLGSLLIDPELCDEVALILQADDFYVDANAKLYMHMMAMHEAGGRIDTMLLCERLKQHGDFDAVGGTAYLGEIIN